MKLTSEEQEVLDRADHFNKERGKDECEMCARPIEKGYRCHSCAKEIMILAARRHRGPE